MDAFYASVEVHDDPRLRGKPVIVGGSPDGSRGVVCSATYEARAFGVRSAMPAGVAHRLCPQAVFLPVRIDRYVAVSDRIHELFLEFTPRVEPLSIDEAFLDLSGPGGFEDAVRQAHAVKARIREETGLTASVGLASNKSVAKIASDLRKPDGFVVVRPGEEQAFLDPLPVSKLWGVGPKTEEELAKLGVRTVLDLRVLDPVDVERRFGKWGAKLHELACGRDDREVADPGEHERGSIGAQSTFERDLGAWADLEERLLGLAERVARRARAKGLAGRTLTLRARYPDFRTVTRNLTLKTPSRTTETLYRAAADLLRRLMRPGDRFRLLGISLSHLCERFAVQKDLFEEPGEPHGDRVDRAMDAVLSRVGENAVVRARLLERRKKRRPGREK
jgi:DNA polymerase-4